MHAASVNVNFIAKCNKMNKGYKLSYKGRLTMGVP